MRRRGLVLLATVLCAVPFAPPGARAQSRLETWLRGTTLRPSLQPPSDRLQAMGDLSVSVEDENNEIGLYDYAHSIAGLLEDRSGSSLDGWYQTSPWNAETPANVSLTEARTLIVSRQGGKRAYGALLGRDQTKFSAPVYPASDLRWAVEMADLSARDNPTPPNADTVYGAAQNVPIDSSFAVRTGRPTVGFLYSTAVGKRVLLGLEELFVRENEQASQRVHYGTEYVTRDWNTGAALAVRPVAGVTLGGTLNYEDQRLDGIADGLKYRASSAHYDTFREYYPTWSRGAHAFLDVGHGIHGALAWDKRSGHGDETYHLNWGDLQALLRTGGAIQRVGTRFVDTTSVTTWRTRWMAHPLAPRYTVGVSLDHVRSLQSRAPGSGDIEIVNAQPVNFDSLTTARVYGITHDTSTGWQAAGGASVALASYATVGAEYVRGHQTTATATTPVAFVTRLRGGRLGGEMWLRHDLAARAGFEQLTSPEIGDRLRRVTAGAGYLLNQRVGFDLLVTVATTSQIAAIEGIAPHAPVKTHTVGLSTRLAF